MRRCDCVDPECPVHPGHKDCQNCYKYHLAGDGTNLYICPGCMEANYVKVVALQ